MLTRCFGGAGFASSRKTSWSLTWLCWERKAWLRCLAI